MTVWRWAREPCRRKSLRREHVCITIHRVNNDHSRLDRCLAPVVRAALARSPVVVLTGARQTGKATLARDILGRGRVYRTLDDMASLEQAQREPDSLVSARQPVTVDEIQRSPDLLLAIKRHVDERRSPSQFLLTGSANLALLARVGNTGGPGGVQDLNAADGIGAGGGRRMRSLE